MIKKNQAYDKSHDGYNICVDFIGGTFFHGMQYFITLKGRKMQLFFANIKVVKKL